VRGAALIRMPRGWRRQRLIAASVIVVVALIGGAAALSGRRTASGDPQTRQTRFAPVSGDGGVIVTISRGTFFRADLRAGTITPARPPKGTILHDPTHLVRRQGFLVFATDGQAFAANIRLEGPVRPLGLALDVFPAARDDRLWLVDQTRVTMHEIDLGGRVTSPQLVVPADAVPWATVETGIVVREPSGRDERLAVIDPANGARTVVGDGEPIAASGRLVVYADTSGARVRVRDVVARTTRDFAPPAGSRYTSTGALSPDGRRLALFLTRDPLAGAVELVVIDLADGSVRIVEHSRVGDRARTAHVVWSSRGDAVFFGGRFGRLQMWRTGEASARSLPMATATAFVAS
jgi:hypothetical protein